jgi:hypothetical protein
MSHGSLHLICSDLRGVRALKATRQFGGMQNVVFREFNEKYFHVGFTLVALLLLISPLRFYYLLKDKMANFYEAAA